MNTLRKITNIAFVSAVLAITINANVNPVFAQSNGEQSKQQEKGSYAVQSIENWVNKGINEVNSGNIDQAIDCFAKASKLVPAKH